jgi:TetR/AcrR family transcriptional regulator, lmrAB and yxaGH operons repressor
VAEVFQELGYEEASLRQITERTGLGQGSRHAIFHGRKKAAAEILADVDNQFAENVFEPFKRDEPRCAITYMWVAVDDFFRSGRRICPPGRSPAASWCSTRTYCRPRT